MARSSGQSEQRPWWVRHWRILASAALLTAMFFIARAADGRPPGIARAGVLLGIAAIFFPWERLKFSLRTALVALTLAAVMLGIGAWIFH